VDALLPTQPKYFLLPIVAVSDKLKCHHQEDGGRMFLRKEVTNLQLEIIENSLT